VKQVTRKRAAITRADLCDARTAHIHTDYVSGESGGTGSARDDGGADVIDSMLYDSRGRLVWTSGGHRIGFHGRDRGT
jgi:hypothetical protein